MINIVYNKSLGDSMISRIDLFFINNYYLKIFFCLLLFLLIIINFLLTLKHKKNNEEAAKKKKNYNIKSDLNLIYLYLIVPILLYFLTNISFLKYILIVVFIPHFFYTIILSPILNKKINFDFVDSNICISFILYYVYLVLLVNIRKNSLYFLSNETSQQLFILIYLFSLLFLSIYIIIINIKYIFYYLSIDFVNKYNDKLYIIINKIKNIHNIFDINNKNNSVRCRIIFNIKILIKLFFLILFNLILVNVLIVIHYFIDLFINRFNHVTNNDIYWISKISIIITVFTIYFIIQISGEFNSKIISSYEFIASTITIPLLLDSLIKKQENL